MKNNTIVIPTNLEIQSKSPKLNAKYLRIEINQDAQCANKERPVMSWTNEYDKIHCLDDDRCFIFILDSTGKRLEWIPKEIIRDLTNGRRKAD